MTTIDMEMTPQGNVVDELLTIYSLISRDEMTVLVAKHPDMFELLDIIEGKEKRKSKKAVPQTERRAQKALEREQKRVEREEKRRERAEYKEARREEKRIRKEQKIKAREEYRALKSEFKHVPKAVIREANDHYANRDLLVNFLQGINNEMKEEDQKMEVETETKIPSVPFDQDIKKAAPGPDNFRRFRAGLDDLKEKLKELKS